MDNEHPSKLDRLMHAVAEHKPLRAAARFVLHDCHVLVEASSAQLIAALREHYAPHERAELTPREEPEPGSARIVLLEATSPDLGLDLQAWPRDTHAPGHRDEYVDIPGGRVVRDPSGSLQFLLGSDLSLVVGDCTRALHRVIELINASVMERLVARGGMACRGAAIALGERGLALAGPPRSGRTTLALRAVEQGARLVAADRFVLRDASDGGWGVLHGMPDALRVNPGTLATSPLLRATLTAAQRAELEQLTASDLWALEDKRALDPTAAFARDVVQPTTALHGLVMLGWQPKRSEPCIVTRTRLAERPALLSQLAKRPGPLCRASMAGHRAAEPPQARDIEQRLAELPVWELAGSVDYARAAELCLELLS